MNRAEQFEHLYNTLDRYLRKQLDVRGNPANRDVPFGTVLAQVAAFNATVRNRKLDLQDMANLRNATVHTRGLNGISWYAEPYPEVLEEFRNLIDNVMNPRRAHDVCIKNQEIFDASQELGAALTLMNGRKYSQILVRDNELTRLVSVIGIKNWLAHHVEDAIVEIGGVRLADILRHEPSDGYGFVSRDMPIDDLRDCFTQVKSVDAERIQVLIVTQSGKATEKPLGIVTPSDVVD